MNIELKKSLQKLEDKMVNFTALYFRALENSDFDNAVLWSRLIQSTGEDLEKYAQHQIGGTR